MAKSESKGLPANVLIDRILHASDSSDAQSSLESLLKSIQEKSEHVVNAIIESGSCLQALSSLIVQSSLPSGIGVEEGQVTALELIQSILKYTPSLENIVKPLLLEPIPSPDDNDENRNNNDKNSSSLLNSSPLLHALLDCLCSSDQQNTSPYPRILSLEIITETHKLFPTLTQENLLSAPEGFHRLISLLHPNADENNIPESIRNATLLLLTNLSQNSSVIRKLLLFSEGYERVLGIAVSLDVNMEKAVVLDALFLCQNLLVEDAASDFGGCEMFFGGGGKHQVNVGGCVRLLDARFFKQAQNVDIREPMHKTSSDSGDDLDDLLNSPSSKITKSFQQECFRVPRMTKDEEEVCHAVLDLFLFAMEAGEANRKDGSTQQTVAVKLLLNQAVMGAILSLALYSPFMETQVPYYASVPSSSLQCHALDMLSHIVPASASSLLTNSSSSNTTTKSENMPSLQNIYPLYEFFAREASQPPLERLISICYQESTSLVSSHSRSSLRHILTTEQTNLIILHSLAPPPPDDEDQNQSHPRALVVKEMIQCISKKEISSEKKQCVFHTLGVLLGNGGDTAKELLLRFPIEGGDNSASKELLTYLFDALEGDMNPDQYPVLNLLCSWSYASPPLTMQTLLRFPQTLTLSPMLEKSNPLAAILLGLWLNYFTALETEEGGANDSDDKNAKNGADMSGWSKETIVKLIQRFGISKFTMLLDSFVKKNGASKDLDVYQISNQTQLKIICEKEEKELLEVHTEMINTIRKSLVSSIASSSSSSESQEMTEMTQMLAQYQVELSTFQQKYAKQEETMLKQVLEIKNLKLKYQPVTPVDEALAKQVDLTAAAEQRVEELEKNLKNQSELASTLQTNNTNLEEEMEIERQDKQDREEELTALSSAYNTLEEEYRKICVPNGEKDESGEDVQITPLDVANMKNELQSLREQIKASDDWMSMAVNRMNDMATENVALEQQITNLASSKSQIEESERHISGLNDHVENLNSEIDQLKEEKKKENNEHAQQIEEMQRELTNLANDLDKERSKEHIQENPFSTTVEIGAVQRLEKKVEKLLEEIEDKDNIYSSKENERMMELAVIRTKNKDVETEKENEMLKAKRTLESLQKDHEVEIQRKMTEIVTLQKEISDLKLRAETSPKGEKTASTHDFFSASPTNEAEQSNGMSEEEEEMLRSELEQLRESNEQAQEWMTNAYGHQESMARDIELLKEENNNLKDEIETLQNTSEKKSSSIITDVSSLNATSQFNDQEINELKKENEELKSKLDDVQTLKSQIDAKISELTSVTGELDVSREEIDELKAKISELEIETDKLRSVPKDDLSSKSDTDDTAMKEELEHVRITCQDLQFQIDNLKEENSTLLTEQENYANAMDQLKSRLSEYQDWTKTAQDRISDLEEERDGAELKVDDMEQSQQKLEERINELTTTISSLKTEVSDYENEKDEISKQTSIERSEFEEKLSNFKAECKKISKKLQTSEDENVRIGHKIESVYNKLGALLGDVQEGRTELSNIANEDIIKVLEENILMKLEKLYQSEKALTDYEEKMKSIIDQNSLDVNKWKDEATKLQEDLHNVHSELAESNQNAHDVIKQWEERYNSITIQLSQSEHVQATNQILSQKIAVLEEDLAKTKSLVPSDDLLEKCSTLSIRVSQLESLLKQKDEAIAMYEEEAAEVLKRMGEDRETAEDALSQWRSTADYLEQNACTLQEKLNENTQFVADQKLEAEEAIAHWEDRCSVLEEQMEEQEQQLDEAEEQITAQDEEINDLKQAASIASSMLESSEARVLALTKDVEYNNARSEEERKVLIAEIESRVEHSMSLEVELDGAQTGYDEFVAKIKEYKDLLVLEQKARISIDELLRGERNRTKQLQLSLKSEVESKVQTDKACERYKNEVDSIKSMLSKYKAKQKSSEEKWKNARIQVGELQGELLDKKEALSSINTDQASVKATEMATNGLRRQIAALQTKLQSEQRKLQNELGLRKSTEDELEKLKGDLALLSYAEESSGSDICGDGQLRKLVSKAADGVFRKERQELEELRKTLKKATDELRLAKATEKEAMEREASLRIHTSMCEQEALTSKNDVTYLNKTIEELRDSEVNNLHTLQARIMDLELNRQNTAQAHLDDLEGMKTELRKSNSEKDRLLHALHESEKINAALVVTETMSKAKGPSDDSDGTEIELAKLKIANAQLLAVAAETGSKTEKRIRAAVAAHAASSEAELLLEKDLRQTAEKLHDDLQDQLDELRAKMKNGGQKETISPAKEILSKKKMEGPSSKEIVSLKEQLQEMSLDCKNSEEKNKSLEDEVNEAKQKIASLTEKCDRLSAQSREASRDVTFEASVASEIAQLRTESSNGINNTNELSQSLVLVNGDKNTNTGINQKAADEMYDLVSELKDAVKQERNLYRDLMVDHEELLAVLAEQDIEIEGLRSGLENLGGEEALQNTLKAVEANLEEKVRDHVMSH